MDLDSYAIIAGARHQGNGQLYFLGTGGKVYRSDSDGQGFVELFDTGFSDLETINVHSTADIIVVGNHTAALFNNRMYGYNLDGGALWNYEARSGLSSFSGGPFAIGSYDSGSFIMHWQSGGLNRFDVSDGSVEGLQGASGLEYKGGDIDFLNNVAFRVIGSGIYQYNPITVNNPVDAVIVASNAPTNNSGIVKWFDDDGVRRYVGCSGGRIWSWGVGNAVAVQNRTASNFEFVITRKPLGG